MIWTFDLMLNSRLSIFVNVCCYVVASLSFAQQLSAVIAYPIIAPEKSKEQKISQEAMKLNSLYLLFR